MSIESLRESFEQWYKEEYSWEITRGRGRLSRTLDMYDGEYTSYQVKNDFKVWCAAHKFKGEK